MTPTPTPVETRKTMKNKVNQWFWGSILFAGFGMYWWGQIVNNPSYECSGLMGICCYLGATRTHKNEQP